MKSILTYLFIMVSGLLMSQQIYIDKGIQVNGLWCFPTHNNPQTYRYLSTKARLALDEEQHPKFSFMRYITEKPSAGENATSSVIEAGGGGILHFLVLYETPQVQVDEAEIMLKELLENDQVSIDGPILFDSASYALVSSILDKENNEHEKRLLSVGKAPVMENSSIALSFDVNPLNSKLLLESFKMDTPDISLVFDLSFSGLSEAYDATLEIDWSEIKKSKSFGAGGNIYFVSADVELGLDELFKNNSIKLVTNGDDDDMEALLNTVYDKLLDLMFKPIEPAIVPEEHRGGLMDALSSIIGQDGALSSGNTFNFGVNASFQMKELRTEGKSNLVFNGRSTVNRHHFITFNIGDLYQTYGSDTRFFRDVPIWDPAFQQREVFVGVDGDLEKEFEDMLNSVTLAMRKKHANGNETLSELIINKETFKNYEGHLSMRYLNQGDSIRTDWLTYEYRTLWKFKGGGGYESKWESENSAMINLFVPFQRRDILLDGNLDLLKEKGVRAISVQIDYPFFDQVKYDRITIRPTDDLKGKSFKITLPNTSEEVNYSITWLRKDASNLSKTGTDRFGLIFIDEIPDE
ncbi:hypothetical protein [Flavivirga spongiicola]|uniref:Uncharacterized protein n=1 Tax=Flavivirga spongiicola TaxID=421621 RepID=A0ABU7XM15_9FLAO|nr:hypothetical protein [Flavivirga sp. MEBiC05379]MDO5981473.1 hypothetical protein [Flavivirga sp. MEBiC05379]